MLIHVFALEPVILTSMDAMIQKWPWSNIDRAVTTRTIVEASCESSGTLFNRLKVTLDNSCSLRGYSQVNSTTVSLILPN